MTVDEFYNKLLSTVILQVTVSNLSDAFSVFSSLNAKGLPLTLVDLLKGQFIGAAARRGIDRNDTLEDWTDFVGMFSPAGEDANVSAVTQFLLNNFDVFESVSAKSITKGKAIRLYENLIQDKYRGGDNYLETLLHRADLFDTITRIPGHEYGVQTIDRKPDALNRRDSTLNERPFVNADKPYADGMTSYRESKRGFCDNGHFVGMRNPIRLNASIPDTANGENIESKTDWTTADITRRTKYLAEEVVRLFAFPQE